MSAKTYWNLLVLFCVLCQGIIGTLSEKDIDESSELLVRQKRVINRAPGGDRRELISNAPYVVSIKRYRIPSSCVGAILTHHIVITAAKCVELEVEKYRVYSGNARAISPSSHSIIHNVTQKSIHLGNYPFRPADGIALITVSPRFSYSINTRNIAFFEGHIHPGTLATVSGWGCNPTGHPGTAYQEYLRTITVPIISLYDCTMLYFHTLPITESDICTLDATGHQYCGVEDVGAPLVMHIGPEQKLVGVHLWNGGVVGRSNPDVFVNLQYPTYKNWLLETIPIMDTSVRRIHQQQRKK